MEPGVYYVRFNPATKRYYLEYTFDSFKLPKKIYGNIQKHVIRIWNHYAINYRTVGCLFTGIPGSGKTQAGQMLSNLAIDNQMPVIMCVEIKFNIELIRFLSSLRNVVLFFDEFRKNVSYDLENQMLTMLVDIADTKKIFILTENDSRAISGFIRDRPERIRYHLEFDKLERAAYEEYCEEQSVDKTFKLDLDELYRRVATFSFDQLQSLVKEHKNYPQDSLSDLLTLLNLHGLIKEKVFKVYKCIRHGDDYEYSYRVQSLGDWSNPELFKSNSIPLVLTLYDRPVEEADLPPVPYMQAKRDLKTPRLYYKDFELAPESNPPTYVYTLDNGQIQVDILLQLVEK